MLLISAITGLFLRGVGESIYERKDFCSPLGRGGLPGPAGISKAKDPRPVFLLLEEVGVSCLAWLYLSVSEVGVLVTQSQR